MTEPERAALLADLPILSVLGVSVAALSSREAIDLFAQRLRDRQFTPVAFLNAHCANVAARNDTYAGVLDRFLVLPDGVGVDIAARWLHGRSFPANLNGTDFIPALLAGVERPLKVGLIGATRTNAEGAARRLSELAPRHCYIVVRDGFFAGPDDQLAAAQVAEAQPDILLVAMGVPRQEMWIANALGPNHCTMPIAVGALFDFLSGSVPRAPQWMRRLRLEWLFRLWIEPGRLWRRYVVGNPVFLWRVLRQKMSR